MNGYGRSREGAWIEMYTVTNKRYIWQGRSREGAWIEIRMAEDDAHVEGVAPARERGLK